MTPFKLFADSVTGSGLPAQFQKTRIWLTSLFCITCAVLLIVSSLNVFETTRMGFNNFREQVGQNYRKLPLTQNFSNPPNPLPEEIGRPNQILSDILVIVVLNNLVLLILLSFIVWVSLYFLLLPLAKSVEEKTKFLNQASHELRTPLAILYSELSLSAEETDPVILKQTHQEALHEIKRLHRLSEKLLGRIGADETELNLEPLDLKSIIQTAWDKLQILNSEHKTMVMDLDQIQVLSDEVLLYQLIFNLIENFLKHSPIISVLNIIFQDNLLVFINQIEDENLKLGTGLEACMNMAKELGLELKVDSKNGVYEAKLVFPGLSVVEIS